MRVGGELRALHFEFEVDPGPELPRRVYGYQAYLFFALCAGVTDPAGPVPPIKSVIVVLRGSKKRPAVQGQQRIAWPEDAFSGARYRLEPVYQRSVAGLRSRGGLVWLVFAPLARVRGCGANRSARGGCRPPRRRWRRAAGGPGRGSRSTASRDGWARPRGRLRGPRGPAPATPLYGIVRFHDPGPHPSRALHGARRTMRSPAASAIAAVERRRLVVRLPERRVVVTALGVYDAGSGGGRSAQEPLTGGGGEQHDGPRRHLPALEQAERHDGGRDVSRVLDPSGDGLRGPVARDSSFMSGRATSARPRSAKGGRCAGSTAPRPAGGEPSPPRARIERPPDQGQALRPRSDLRPHLGGHLGHTRNHAHAASGAGAGERPAGIGGASWRSIVSKYDGEIRFHWQERCGRRAGMQAAAPPDGPGAARAGSGQSFIERRSFSSA